MPTDKKQHLDDDDIFSLIPSEVAPLIAGICGHLGVGRCTCIEIGNVVRRATGKPTFPEPHASSRRCMRKGCNGEAQGTLSFCSKRCDDLFYKRTD